MAATFMDTHDTEPIETLAERMAGGVLPVFYSLLWATDIACVLRDYHVRGLVHGDVTAETIRLHQAGVRLQPRAEGTTTDDLTSDVVALGKVLYQMIEGCKPSSELVGGPFDAPCPVRNLADVRSEAGRLAKNCLSKSVDIQHVLIELRILGLLARGLEGVPRRVKVISKPAQVKPERHRLRIVGRSLTAPPPADRGAASDKAERPRLQLVPSSRPALRLMPGDEFAASGEVGEEYSEGAGEPVALAPQLTESQDTAEAELTSSGRYANEIDA
jgi:hypothetical protein